MKDPSSISSARLLTLYQVGRKINTQLDPDRLLDEIMDLAIGLLEAEKGLILWRDSASDELVAKTARHIDKKNVDDVVALSRSIVKKVEQNATPDRQPDRRGYVLPSSSSKKPCSRIHSSLTNLVR